MDQPVLPFEEMRQAVLKVALVRWRWWTEHTGYSLCQMSEMSSRLLKTNYYIIYIHILCKWELFFRRQSHFVSTNLKFCIRTSHTVLPPS